MCTATTKKFAQWKNGMCGEWKAKNTWIREKITCTLEMYEHQSFRWYSNRLHLWNNFLCKIVQLLITISVRTFSSNAMSSHFLLHSHTDTNQFLDLMQNAWIWFGPKCVRVWIFHVSFNFFLYCLSPCSHCTHTDTHTQMWWECEKTNINLFRNKIENFQMENFAILNL